MTEREGAPLSFVVFWRPPPPPPTPQYLTILMTEGGGAIIFCSILAPLNALPPSPDATILKNAPSPDATILNYLNDKERGCH